MILRLFGLLFGAGALVLGMFGGWHWAFGDVLMRVNARALAGLQDGVGRIFWSGAWDSLVMPLLAVPAWCVLAAVAIALFAVAAFQPAKA